tara:strand:- start:169 stop:660 length:492 start_codon:yes stop_codon:yes gene_type:complete
MKDKFFKFFEIGKLDKGLFRIWIILSAAWLIFFSIVFLNSWEFGEYKEAIKQNNYKVNCESFYKKVPVWKKNETTGISEVKGFLTTNTIVYGNKKEQESILGAFSLSYFESYALCVHHYKKIKSEALLNLIPGIIFYILTPFLVALIYLFSKKGFLWIRQGFK